MKKELIDKIQRHAKSRRVELHESFFIELENYSGHIGVKDLPPDKLDTVVNEIARLAIEKASKQQICRVGGGAVRTTIGGLCPEPYSDCRKAASKILEEHVDTKLDRA